MISASTDRIKRLWFVQREGQGRLCGEILQQTVCYCSCRNWFLHSERNAHNYACHT